MKKVLLLMLMFLTLGVCGFAQSTLTVADGTETNEYVPVYGYYADDYLRCQTIYPSSLLTGTTNITGESIQGVTYYLSTPAYDSWGSASFVVKVKEVTDATLTAFVDMTNATTVYTGPLDGTLSTMEIMFTTPYNYQGGNLLIEISSTTEGDYSRAYFYGITAIGASWQGYSSTSASAVTGSARDFIPKTTFMYGTPPTCFKVTNLAVDASQTTTNSVTLTWTDALNTSATYNIYDMSDTSLIQSGVSGLTYTVTGLTGSTAYTFGVQTDCGGGDIALGYATVTANTACAALTLPYTETFESNSGTIQCWSVDGSGSWVVGTGDYSTSTGSYQGTQNALITHSSTGNVTKLISPILDGVQDGLMLDFAYVMRSWSGDIDELRVYSRAAADSAWQLQATYTAAAATWTAESITIPGTVYQVAFEHTDNYGYGLGIDNVAFTAMSSNFCYAVSNLSVDNSTTNSITISWSDGNNTGATYDIYDMSDTSLIQSGVSGLTYTVTGLTASTVYTFGVQTNCGGGNIATGYVTVEGHTACVAVTLPYTETFASTSGTRNCWSLVSMNTGNDLGTSYGMGFYTIDGREALRFSSYSNHGGSNDYNQYGFSPLFDVNTSATFLNVTVTYATYNSSNKLYFGYVTSTDTVWDPTEYTTTSSTDWQTQTFVIPTTATQLAVNYYGNYSFYAWIDSVVVTEMTGDYCFPVTDLAASNITAHEATLTWSGDANTYTVINMTDGTVLTTQADTSYNITGLTSETQYTFGVVANCTTVNSDTMTVNFTTLISCPVPTGLTATLTPGNGTVASLSWTENGTATEWQICLNGDTANLITATTNPYNFTGLTPETAYTVAVRAICDVNDMSVWSSQYTFTPTNAYVLTVNDGTATNNYVPVYGTWVDNITKSQFIIPAADLTAMQYDTITKMTFYASNDTIEWGAAMFDVYVTETSETTVSALVDYSSMTQVYAGSLSILGNKMEVTFTTPYVYMGGNLMMGFLQTVPGTWKTCSWYGVSATGASMGGYGTSISQQNFLPKTTFAFTPGTQPSCLPVTNLAVSNVTDAEATITWNGTAPSYVVYNGTTPVATVTTTTYTFTGLTAATNYVFGVQAICSATDSSIVVNVAATTECADVTTLPYNEGFENGFGCWSTINGSSDGQPWSIFNCAALTSVDAHGGSYVASSWSWSTVAMHADAWLISPKFVLPNVADSLTFAWWEITSSGYPDHYSVVLSTTTSDTAAFTTVVYPYSVAAGNWTMKTVNLSAYAGQSVYLAFHHVDYNENYLLIDDISLFQGAYVPPAPDTLTVTFAVNDATMGTTVPAPGTYYYITGDTVRFHPEANAGYHFNNWVMSAAGQTDTLAPNYVSVYFLANSFMSYGTVTLTALFEADSTGTVTNPTVATNAATAVGETNATLNATITNPDNVTITAKGFEWKTTTGGTFTQIAGTGTGNTFTADLTGLTPNTGYTFKAFITYNGTTVYGSEMTFTTQSSTVTPPTVTTNDATSITQTTATLNGAVTAGDETITAQGFEWKETAGGTYTTVNATGATMSYDLTGLTPNTSYTFKAFATTASGTTYGEEKTFTTLQVGINDYDLNNVVVYPNPTKGTVQIQNTESRIQNVEVYDAYGKLLNVVNVNDNTAAIDLTNYAAGTYFVKIMTENGMVTKRVVKN